MYIKGQLWSEMDWGLVRCRLWDFSLAVLSTPSAHTGELIVIVEGGRDKQKE